jgi:hypothetical protein
MIGFLYVLSNVPHDHHTVPTPVAAWSKAAWFLELWVGILPGGMDVCFV